MAGQAHEQDAGAALTCFANTAQSEASSEKRRQDAPNPNFGGGGGRANSGWRWSVQRFQLSFLPDACPTPTTFGRLAFPASASTSCGKTALWRSGSFSREASVQWLWSLELCLRQYRRPDVASPDSRASVDLVTEG